MKRIYFLLSFLIFGLTLLAQNAPTPTTAKVGVNTHKPSYQLDVNGTLRVSDIPEVPQTDNVALLKWLPYSNSTTEDNQGLLVRTPDKDFSKAFQIVEYYFLIDQEGEDKVNKIDLGIPADRYSMFMTECDLLQVNDENFIEDPTQAHPAFIPLALLTSPINVEPTFSEFALSRTRPGLPSEEYANGGLQVPLPNVHLYKAASPLQVSETWHFFADYPSVKPKALHFESPTSSKVIVDRYTPTKFAWSVKILVVDNEYMDALDELEKDMGGNQDGSVTLPIEIRQ